jgi:hypothetical protein
MGRPKKSTIKSPLFASEYGKPPYFAKEKKKVVTKAEREKDALGIPFVDVTAFPKELFVPSTSILSFSEDVESNVGSTAVLDLVGTSSQAVAEEALIDEKACTGDNEYLFVAKYQLVYIKRYAASRKAVEV